MRDSQARKMRREDGSRLSKFVIRMKVMNRQITAAIRQNPQAITLFNDRDPASAVEGRQNWQSHCRCLICCSIVARPESAVFADELMQAFIKRSQIPLDPSA